MSADFSIQEACLYSSYPYHSIVFLNVKHFFRKPKKYFEPDELSCKIPRGAPKLT